MVDLKPILYVIKHELLKKDSPYKKERLLGFFKVFESLAINLILSDLKDYLVVSEIDKLISQDPKIEDVRFIQVFVKFLHELYQSEPRGIDEVYTLYGMAEGFARFHYCYKMSTFKSLVHHLGIYANAWPAKFGLEAIRSDLQDLIREYRSIMAPPRQTGPS